MKFFIFIIFFLMLPQNFILCENVDIQSIIDRRIEYNYNRAIVVAEVTEPSTKFYYAFDKYYLNSENHPTEAVFEIGSLTKLFTAHLTHLLVEEGLISLDEPIETYLPNQIIPQYLGCKINLRHLLTHTSGIKDPIESCYNLEESCTPTNAFTEHDLYAYIAHLNLTETPGSKINYSNVGYGLVGLILQHVTNRNYEDLLREKILKPYGLEKTFVNFPKDKKLWKIEGTSNGVSASDWDTRKLPAFASLKSTVGDLSLYLRRLFFPINALDKKIGEMITTPYILWDKQAIIATCGMTIDCRYSNHFYAATGKTLGFSSFFSFFAKKRIGIVVLTDSDSMGNLGHHLINHQFPLDVIFKQQAVCLETLRNYEGTYKRCESEYENQRIKIHKRGNHLVMQFMKEVPVHIYPLTSTRFFSKYLDKTNGFFIDFHQKDNQLFLVFRDQENQIYNFCRVSADVNH